MLKNLFKSGWKSNSVDKRLRFVEDVDVSVAANQAILEKLAANDVDADVRHGAMAKIVDPQALYNLRLSHAHSDSRQFAETTFRHLIQSNEFSEVDCRTFLANNPKSNLLIAMYSPHADLRNEILGSLGELEQAKIIADIPYSVTRVMVAEKIQSIGPLEIARKNLKGRDKSAEKVIKAKIDLIHAKQKLDLENAALAKSIREKMEALARYIAWSDEIKGKFFDLAKSWDAFAFDPSEAEKTLYQKAFAKVSEDVKRNMAKTLSEQNQQKVVSTLEVMCSEVAAYSLDKLLSENTAINSKLSDLSWQWLKESEVTPYSADANERFIQAKQSLESADNISRCVSAFRKTKQDNANNKNASAEVNQQAKAVIAATERSNWSGNFPALTSSSDASLEAKKVLNAVHDERKKAKEALDNLHKKINRLFGAANRGELNRAQRELAAVVNAASRYGGKERKHLDERIQEATESVKKMGDWKDFALEPKLVDLCEQMEVLANIETPNPDKQAVAIKKLQQAWKALGSSDICDTYWPRFKEAADKAYEPCSIFFKQRRETQRENLKKRDPLVSELKALFETTDWDAKPDYKSVEDKVSQIMQRWKKIKDVEHGAGQKQWNKLSKIKGQINEKLAVEYDENIAAKHALTAQLEQILEQGVTEQSLDKLQFIQSKWKQVGVTKRNQDQAAWVKFKASSDAVYQKIQDLRQAKRSVEDEQIAAYKQIHSQILSLAKSTQDLAVSDKEFEALEAQYKALPALPNNLPEKITERLSKEYAQACNAYDGAKERLDRAKVDKELATLAAKAALCSELEQLPEGAGQAEVLAVQDKINSLELSNNGYAKRFAKRLAKARDIDREGYSSAQRLFLIESEILLSVDSPTEDKRLRLQTQMERMEQQGIGSASTSASGTTEELKIEWFCLPGGEAKLQKQFDDRFKQLLVEAAKR